MIFVFWGVTVFVRRVSTASGVTAVHVVTKTGREATGIERWGSAHSHVDLAVPVEATRERVRERARHAGQVELDLGLDAGVAPSRAVVKRRVFADPVDTQSGVYESRPRFMRG